MKLNLWMIANRLIENYDIETMISASAERTISGPLPVESTGSVYVRNEGTDIICHAEQGTIVIHDVESKEGLLLIQSIFNWYDNWIDRVTRALRSVDYPMFVHLCSQVFSNPVMLQDSNSLLMAMDCRGLPINKIPEWRFIYEVEQSSVSYYLAMAEALNKPVFRYNENVVRFSAQIMDEDNRHYQTSGLSCRFRFLASNYGQLTVLDKKRALNPGDAALLIALSEMGSLLFAAMERNESPLLNRRVMNDLLEGNTVPLAQVNYHYSLIARNAVEGNAHLCLFLFRYDHSGEKLELIDLLSSVLSRQYPALYGGVFREDLIYIVYVPEPVLFARQMYSFIENQGCAENLHAGVSLPFDDLVHLQYYYEQADYALKNSRKSLCFFYNCARRFFVENIDTGRKIAACEPTCRSLWKEEDKREFLLTLEAYLSAERSAALAAERLFVHRNTVNYRVRYLKENCGWDYDNDTLRDYLRLSIYFLSHFTLESSEK